jgi:hypothetical protein
MPARFCEASLCAWIRQPGNTWSNIGFLVVAALIWRATAPAEDRHLRPMAWMVLAIGLGSAFFHASETRVGEWLDYGGMYLGSSYMTAVVLHRLFAPPRAVRTAVFWVLFGLGMSTLLLEGPIVRHAFMASNLFCPTGELLLALRRSTRARSYRWFWAAYAAMTPAFVLWLLDEQRVLCDPENHLLSGHAAWHLLSALMYGASFLYYRQFAVLRAT